MPTLIKPKARKLSKLERASIRSRQRMGLEEIEEPKARVPGLTGTLEAVKGDTGAAGGPGADGSEGREGRAGREGREGREGSSGKEGKPGVGLEGKQGETGRPGADGRVGRVGPAGKTGPPGKVTKIDDTKLTEKIAAIATDVVRQAMFEFEINSKGRGRGVIIGIATTGSGVKSQPPAGSRKIRNIYMRPDGQLHLEFESDPV